MTVTSSYGTSGAALTTEQMRLHQHTTVRVSSLNNAHGCLTFYMPVNVFCKVSNLERAKREAAGRYIIYLTNHQVNKANIY